MQQIENWLRVSMGLDAASIGSSSLHRTIRLRMNAAGVKTAEDYLQLLQVNVVECDQLIESVVITETWFFRDQQAFSAIANIAVLDWLPAKPSERINILSLPCSSGEEPYSIAMALLDAGVPATRFTVEGVDLSQTSLDRAILGSYGKNSFRGQDLAFRNRHFRPNGCGYVINQIVRDCVTFRRANLLNAAVALGQQRYDFIFCRNLLIYFNRETQARAFAKLELLLAQDGTLFVGPAEVPLALNNGFATVTLPMSFACRRATDATRARRQGRAAALRPPSSERRKVPARDSTTITPRTNAKREPTPPPAPTATAAPRKGKPAKTDTSWLPDTLGAARSLADNGKLDEAAQICHAHVQQTGASVSAYYLLGLIHDAQGNPLSREFYRKALYLDPNHYESLLQMALLAEKDGDLRNARNFRRRAERVQRPTQ